MLACLQGWTDWWREVRVQREKDGRKELACATMLKMVASEDSLLLHSVLTQWVAGAASIRVGRQQEEKEALLHAEVRKYQEMHRAALQRRMEKWGEGRSAVVKASMFLGWRGAVEEAARSRKHADRIVMMGFGERSRNAVACLLACRAGRTGGGRSEFSGRRMVVRSSRVPRC